MGHWSLQPFNRYRQRTCRTCSNSRRATRERIPSSGWQLPLFASTHFSRNFLGIIGTKQIHDSTRPNTPRDSKETSTLPQRAQECHSMMVRSRLHRRTFARHDLCICRCILCRYIPTSTFVSRIRLLAQQRCYLLARSRTTLIVLNAVEAEVYSLFSTKSHLSPQGVHRDRIPTKQHYYYVQGLSGSSRFIQRKQISQSQQTHLPSLELCCRTKKSRHWRHSHCRCQPHRYACRDILLTSTRIELYTIPQHNIGPPTDAHRIATNWGEGRLLLDLGSCWLWIPNGSLPYSPIHRHALVMQNTTIVWLSIDLM